MADVALRSLLAQFVVEVDKTGELGKGNTAVDALKLKLQELTASAAPASKAITDAFSKIGQTVATTRIAAPGITPPPAGGGKGGRIASAFGAFKSGFNESSGLSGAIGGLATLRNGILALGAGAAVHALTGLVDHIGDINESAMRLGVSIGDFQRLDVLAKQSGTSVGALGTAFRTLAGNAVNPTKESAKAFAQLHVETKNADGTFKSRNDLFFETAGALADISDGTERAALAQQIYGRSAVELIPLLSEGREGLEKQRAALEQLPVLTDEAVKSADELSDSWKTLGPTMLAAAGPILTKLLIPGLKMATELLVKMGMAIAKWTRDLSPANVLAGGLALKLSSMIGPINANANGLLRMAGAGAKAALQFAKIAAAFLLIEDFIGFFQGKESVIGELLSKAFGAEAVEGTRKALHDLVDVIKELLGLITGKGLGEKTRQIGSEISEFGNVLANDAASKFGIGQGGTQGPLQGNDLVSGALSALGTLTPFGGLISAGGAALQGTQTPQQNNVTMGDQTVIINGVNPNSASAVAGAVRGELGRDRAAIIAPYVPALGT